MAHVPSCTRGTLTGGRQATQGKSPDWRADRAAGERRARRAGKLKCDAYSHYYACTRWHAWNPHGRKA
eukprot:925027-Pyramimonas_sp.AAC.1